MNISYELNPCSVEFNFRHYQFACAINMRVTNLDRNEWNQLLLRAETVLDVNMLESINIVCLGGQYFYEILANDMQMSLRFEDFNPVLTDLLQEMVTRRIIF